MSTTYSDNVTIRLSRGDDEHAVAALAQLESSRPPLGVLLLAEQGGELRAALPLADGPVIADPFHLTADLVRLLQSRRRQLVTVPRRRWLRRKSAGSVAPLVAQ